MVKQNQIKQAVANAAISYLEKNLASSSIIGIGTGSTANYFIAALPKIKNLISGAVASSEQSANKLREVGINLVDLNSIDSFEYYIDGADEINQQLQMIKGGGGALMREKIVASVANKFICIADKSKLVNTLGIFPLPIEVIPMAENYLRNQLIKLGGNPTTRKDFITDNGNIIIDLHGLNITDPIKLESKINQIVGVVGNGIFAQRPADILLLGYDDKVEEIQSSKK